MARQSRAISESGYYHIMLRGTGKRRLFEDDLDRRAFLRFASTAAERYGVRELTVNEQNPQAVGFYEHLGFSVWKRTERDEEGGEYPLLYMRK